MMKAILLYLSIWLTVVSAAEKELSASKLRSMGDSALHDRDFAKALDLYTKAINKEPQNEKNYYKRFKVYDKMKKTTAALEDLNHAISLNAEYVSAIALRGKTLMSLGQCADAVSDYQFVLKLKPTHGDAKKLLPKAIECDQEISMTEHLIKAKRWEEAEKQIDSALERVGNVPYLKMLRAEVRYHAGKCFESIADTGDILKHDKDNIDALLLRGKAYYKVADHEMTLRHLREALKSDPEHAETKHFYKMVKKLVKLYDDGEKKLNEANHQALVDALELFKQAVRVDPSHGEFNKHIFLKICKCEAKLKHVNEAKQACDSALRLDRELLDGYLLIGDMLLKSAEETPEFEEAVRYFQRAAEVDRNDHRVQDGLRRAETGLKQSKQKNYYKILGIARDAETSHIKKAYRKLAKLHHPDMHAHESEAEQEEAKKRFQEIGEAYEVLSDDTLRGKYDRGEDVFENQGGGGGHPRGHGFPFHGFQFHNRR